MSDSKTLTDLVESCTAQRVTAQKLIDYIRKNDYHATELFDIAKEMVENYDNTLGAIEKTQEFVRNLIDKV